MPLFHHPMDHPVLRELYEEGVETGETQPAAAGSKPRLEVDSEPRRSVCKPRPAFATDAARHA